MAGAAGGWHGGRRPRPARPVATVSWHSQSERRPLDSIHLRPAGKAPLAWRALFWEPAVGPALWRLAFVLGLGLGSSRCSICRPLLPVASYRALGPVRPPVARRGRSCPRLPPLPACPDDVRRRGRRLDNRSRRAASARSPPSRPGRPSAVARSPMRCVSLISLGSGPSAGGCGSACRCWSCPPRSRRGCARPVLQLAGGLRSRRRRRGAGASLLRACCPSLLLRSLLVPARPSNSGFTRGLPPGRGPSSLTGVFRQAGRTSSAVCGRQHVWPAPGRQRRPLWSRGLAAFPLPAEIDPRHVPGGSKQDPGLDQS